MATDDYRDDNVGYVRCPAARVAGTVSAIALYRAQIAGHGVEAATSGHRSPLIASLINRSSHEWAPIATDCLPHQVMASCVERMLDWP